MSSEDTKAKAERDVFMFFVRAGDLRVDFESMESRQPPEPDIRCTVAGHPRRVELVEITDQKLAARRARAIRGDRPTGGAFSGDDSLFYAVASKYEKTYETAGEPLFLLAYYEKQYPVTSADVEVVPRTIRGVAQSMITFGGWSGVWVFDSWNHDILWSYPEDLVARWNAA